MCVCVCVSPSSDMTALQSHCTGPCFWRCVCFHLSETEWGLEQNDIELLLKTAPLGLRGRGQWTCPYTAIGTCGCSRTVGPRSCFRAYHSQAFERFREGGSIKRLEHWSQFSPKFLSSCHFLTAGSVHCYSYQVRASCTWYKVVCCFTVVKFQFGSGHAKPCKSFDDETLQCWAYISMYLIDAVHFCHLACQCAVSFVKGCPHELLQNETLPNADFSCNCVRLQCHSCAKSSIVFPGLSVSTDMHRLDDTK